MLVSYNYEYHGLEALKNFPTSTEFYSCFDRKLNELNLRSLFYTNTCNRTEILFEYESEEHATTENAQLNLEVLAGHCGFVKIKRKPLYLQGQDALRHLFQVACGLRSMALGENQIIGQLRRDAQLAEESGLINGEIKKVLQKAFGTQKIVRNQTGLSAGSDSIMSLLHAELQGNPNFYSYDRAAIGGTGDMANKALQFIAQNGLKEVIIIRQDLDKPLPEYFEQTLKKYRDILVTTMDWNTFLEQEDLNLNLLISATQTRKALLTINCIQSLFAKNVLIPQAPIIDLGIPANIERNQSLDIYRLDHLLKQANEKSVLRNTFFQEARPIIEKAIISLWLDLIYADNHEVVTGFLSKSDSYQREELEDLFQDSLSDLSSKKRRILEDFLRKYEKRTLRTHKELFLEVLFQGSDNEDSTDYNRKLSEPAQSV
jgi:glutamyl-tRNA reductase